MYGTLQTRTILSQDLPSISSSSSPVISGGRIFFGISSVAKMTGGRSGNCKTGYLKNLSLEKFSWANSPQVALDRVVQLDLLRTACSRLGSRQHQSSTAVSYT